MPSLFWSLLRDGNRKRQPDDDVEYYQSKILEIGQQEVANAPHPLLSQNIRLPKITVSGRGHIGIVGKRLDMVLKPSTNLYGYQLHTVLWCHELERSILAKQTLCIGSNDLRFCSGSNCAVYVKENSANFLKIKWITTSNKKAKARICVFIKLVIVVVDLKKFAYVASRLIVKT